MDWLTRDVIIGALLGAFLGLLITIIYNKIIQKRKNKLLFNMLKEQSNNLMNFRYKYPEPFNFITTPVITSFLDVATDHKKDKELSETLEELKFRIRNINNDISSNLTGYDILKDDQETIVLIETLTNKLIDDMKSCLSKLNTLL